jgi:hypothetical protein
MQHVRCGSRTARNNTARSHPAVMHPSMH